MLTSINLRIVVRSDKKNASGLIPLYLQFIQNRKTNRIALRKWIHSSDWVDKSGTYVTHKGSKSTLEAKQMNSFLRRQLARAEDIILEAQRKELPISFLEFKRKFINPNNLSFYAFCDNEIIKRAESKKYSEETLRGYKSKMVKLKNYKPFLNFIDVTPVFLNDLEAYLRNFGNSVNTIYSMMKFLRTMVNEARRQKLMKDYPFDQYKVVYKKDTRDRLSIDELKQLQKCYDQGYLPSHLQETLRYFLFACYTGLTWRDLVTLKYDEIQKRGSTYLISSKRQKTDNHFIVPLLNEAIQLIDVGLREGPVFPNIKSNQKANVQIKKVIQTLAIKKQISFHCARHTFGTVAMNHGIPMEIVQKMMGHSKREMTQIYAKVLDNYVIDEMRKWDNGSDKDENFTKRLQPKVCTKYKKLLTRLVATRITSGKNLAEMAKQLDIQTSDYEKIEKGELQLGVGDLLELVEVLGIELKLKIA